MKHLTTHEIENLQKTANIIRGLVLDAVSSAQSGHAGLALGCAEIGAYLYGYLLRYQNSSAKWMGRDRFILSAGHGSLLLYSCLHLSGFDLSLKDLASYRQIDSKTPGHPEYGRSEGIESTTGLDGHGIAHGVGQALGLKLLKERFHKPEFSLFDAKVYVLAGDGCFMEGVGSEVSSLAGHLSLDNLIVIYDSNKTCLDGYVAESFSEDVRKRYEAYGWATLEIDGHDFVQIHAALAPLLKNQTKPVLVIAHTKIGMSLIHKMGTPLAHGGALSMSEVKEAKKFLELPQMPYYVSDEVKAFFLQKKATNQERFINWRIQYEAWQNLYPELEKELACRSNAWAVDELENIVDTLVIEGDISGRRASQIVIDKLAEYLPSLYGGSADLAKSDMTHMASYPVITAKDFSGRNIKYGVREFGMAAVAIGLAQVGGIIPFIGTFLAFSDYMQSAIRLTAMMKLKVIYQFTHDSFYLGADGPTHQPVEQLAILRAIPHLQVIRPCDQNEVKNAWIAALSYQGPTALVLSKQELPQLEQARVSYANGVGRGAYIVQQEKEEYVDTLLIATGSEVSLAIDVAKHLEERKISVRVVSMPSWEIFERQDTSYKQSVLGRECKIKVSIEAGSSQGWSRYVLDGLNISLNHYGLSGEGQDLAKKFGFTVDAIEKQIVDALHERGVSKREFVYG